MSRIGYVLTFTAINLGSIIGGKLTDRLIAKRVISLKEVCAVLVSIVGMLIVTMANVAQERGEDEERLNAKHLFSLEVCAVFLVGMIDSFRPPINGALAQSTSYPTVA